MADIPGITGGTAGHGTQWECPYCGMPQILTNPKLDNEAVRFSLSNPAEGDLALRIVALACSNPDCRMTTIGANLHSWTVTNMGPTIGSHVLETYRLRPRGREKPQPEYIPAAIRKDYREACLILDSSANASATLARRCLQGVLMDFVGVKKGLLVKQIDELRTMIEEHTAPPGVTLQSADLIDHVREFGNVGAHMEAATGLIVDVEPEEASLLIELVETLFRDWYVERHSREQRFSRMTAMAAGKREAIATSRAAAKAANDKASEDDRA